MGWCAGGGSTLSTSSPSASESPTTSARRQDLAPARLPPHQRSPAPSGSGRADRGRVQKNFPATLRAHLAHLPQGKPIEIWFQDEARIGQKNGIVRQWARRGTRPRQPADQRYDSAYLFGAICPARGTGAALALPYADTEAMQLHLDEISRTVTRGAQAVPLLDRAGWHTTGQLVVPKNLTLIFLPSRAPELVWGYSCQVLSMGAPPDAGWLKVAGPELGRAMHSDDLRGARLVAGLAPRNLVSGGPHGSG